MLETAITFSWRDIGAKGRGSLWWLLRVISWMGPVISGTEQQAVSISQGAHYHKQKANIFGLIGEHVNTAIVLDLKNIRSKHRQTVYL